MKYEITEQEAREMLNLPGQFARHDLKSAFRRLSLTKHPDHGGSHVEFVQLMDAFKVLESLAKSDHDLTFTHTIEGQNLDTLGKGFPLSVSARTCDICNGRGYKEWHSMWGPDTKVGEQKCPTCGGCKLLRYPCKRCKGEGKTLVFFSQIIDGKKVSGKRRVDCDLCQGSGLFYPVNKFNPVNPIYIPGTKKIGVPCGKCLGRGKVDVRENVMKGYSTCPKCCGIGEVEMFNPVIPRGFLSKSGS